MKPDLGFLDNVLRRRLDLGEELLSADQARVAIRGAVIWILILGGIYGLCMGSYTGFQGSSWLFALASMVKVPFLLLITTMLCFPALYVFGVSGGASLRARSLLAALLLAQVVLTLALAALVPVVLFFMTTTDYYSFVKLLHVLVWTVAGFAALRFLNGLLKKMDQQLAKNRRLMVAWMVLFALVGSQMGWMMRPFIGRPGEPFSLTRETSGSLYADVLRSTTRLVKKVARN